MSRTPALIALAVPTYGSYVRWRHRITVSGMEHIQALQGPYLVLANHVHALDPVFISSVWPKHIRWVAGAHLFKLACISFVLGRLATSISKQQGRSDFQTIKDISQAFKKQDVVGLFPEGTRTWDGEPLGFDISTAKMVRMFHVPVVMVTLEGGYGLKPRWARFARKGSLTIRIHKPLTEDEIKRLSLDKISSILQKTLGFSYRTWQQQSPHAFVSPKNAEGLEQVLYMCPRCHGRSTIVSKGNVVECSHCHFRLVLNEYDVFDSPDENESIPFRDVPQWHRWEKESLKKLCADDQDDIRLFPADNGVRLQQGIGRKRLKMVSKRFTATLTKHAIEVQCEDRNDEHRIIKFPRTGIRSLILNIRGTIELFLENTLYRIQLDSDRSTLKYLEWFETTKEEQQWNGTISST